MAIAGLGAQQRYTGTLDADLRIVSGFWATFAFKPATDADLHWLPPSAGRSGVLHAGRLPETDTPFVLAETPPGAAILYVDLNADGKYSSDERLPFHRLPANAAYTSDQRGWPTQEVCFDIPIAGKSFPRFPVCIHLYDPAKSTFSNLRSLNIAAVPWVTGSVAVRGRNVRVGYEYNFSRDSIDVANGWLGLREGGPGPVDFPSASSQTAYAQSERVVFRAGDLYLSTESADLKQRRVLLRSHPSSDYLRVELQRGVRLPDWTFVDLKGRSGSLDAYRGRYVMLDVWTASCGPCRGEFPLLKKLAAQFKSRGFEILGVLGDDDETDARRVEEKYQLAWRTAASATTVQYVTQRLRIASWPTHILLDPEGRIITASDSDLRGAALESTLYKLLPDAPFPMAPCPDILSRDAFRIGNSEPIWLGKRRHNVV
jgi:thiol-disulfide isomerase/thioredoxin